MKMYYLLLTPLDLLIQLRCLDTRQIKSLPFLEEIRKTVNIVWQSHGNQLQPIPKILMRGFTGSITEEIFCMSQQSENITWLRDDKLLHRLLKSLPVLTDELFFQKF